MEKANALLRTNEAENEYDFTLELIYNRQVDTVFRVCFLFMKNVPDAEDCVQDTFLKLIKKQKIFENHEHEKAWLIVTASNICKNKLRNWWNRGVNLESIQNLTELSQVDSSQGDIENDYVLNEVLSLPEKYKLPVYLYYFSGYKTDEVAKILKKNPNTVRTLLRRARKILEEKLLL